MVQRVAPVQAGMKIGKPVTVVKGLAPEITLKAEGTIQMVVKNTDLDRLALEVTAPATLEAPVEAGKEAGHVRVMLDNAPMGETPLIIAESVEQKRFKHRLRELVGLDP